MSAADTEASGKRRLAGVLAKRFFLRFHLSLILGFSFAVGLLTTKLLLLLGLEALLVRWPLAVLAAYAGFLLGIRVWLAYVGLGRHLGRNGKDSSFDLPDLNFSGGGGCDNAAGSGFSLPEVPAGSGGSFGGGGASGDFAVLDAGGGGVADALPGIDLPDVDLGGADEGCLPVVILMLILALLAAVFGVGVYVVWQAPFLLAEAAFEAALAAGLVGSARRVDDPGWIGGALRGSWKPFLWVLAITVLMALLVAHFVPQARTLLEAARLLLASV